MKTSNKKIVIEVETTVNLPVGKVWEFFIQPMHITKWNHASNDWYSPRAVNDLRPGGKFNYRMEALDGSEGFDFEGVYDDIKTHRLIIYTLGDNRKVTTTFAENGQQTVVKTKFEAENENPPELQKDGWQAILDNFRNYAEGQPALMLEAKAALQIQKPAHEVFEAIVEPSIMSNYFISQGSARMEEGKAVVWRFPEFDFEAAVRVRKIEKNRRISFSWDGETGELAVEMHLESCPDGSTIVRISEKGMDNNEAGIKWLVGNTEGWANFLACLKAWLEYGIHLRRGAFDFMKEK